MSRAEAWLVRLIAAHSFGVALALALFPALTLRLGGFAMPEDLFFVRQGGIFHAVLATAYLYEHARHGTVSLLIFAKAFATVFLFTSWWLLDAAPLVILAAVGDLAMGALVWWVHRHRGVSAAPRATSVGDAARTSASS